MRRWYEDRIVAISVRMVVPFIQLFGLYVVFHGHYSPGGGFQGGAIVAAGFLLVRLAVGTDVAQIQFRSRWATAGSSMGALIFVGIGVVALLYGGSFLDHGSLPFGLEPAEIRNLAILLVELGVMLTVATTITAIYDDLMGEPEPEPEEDDTADDPAGSTGLRTGNGS